MKILTHNQLIIPVIEQEPIEVKIKTLIEVDSFKTSCSCSGVIKDGKNVTIKIKPAHLVKFMSNNEYYEKNVTIGFINKDVKEELKIKLVVYEKDNKI